ncbi:MAG: class I SAM-dependent methyltransferase [Novosphingobium sp.]|uniref:class I SAM-dependent methyltransferase n=1 Tax=Novosphingobium sp. TaxID=1874826 RepID=UPI0032B815E3
MEHYRRAIAQAVKPGDSVVDLGCGFAPLGLMALRAGAGQVWGIDSTDAIAIARETVDRAGLGDRYHCLRENSFRAQLPERVDVLLCDHVGYFGIDYGIGPMLADARTRMLKPGGTILPGAVALHVAGVQSAACRSVTDEWTALSIPADFGWLKEYSANTKRAVTLAPGEIATTPDQLLTLDLNDDIADNLQGEVELVAAAGGQLDGLAGWFECTLVPGISMTNSPLDSRRIDRNQAFFPFAASLPVAAGDRIRVAMNLRHDSNIYSWSARNLRSGERRRQSTLRAAILSPDDLTAPDQRLAALGPRARAGRIVADYADGTRTFREVEDAVRRDHPGLMPSEAELRRFVRAELTRLSR